MTPTSRPFSDEELRSGVALELRTVRTPKPGDTVEVGFLLTDTILCLNRVVQELEEVKRRLAVAEARGVIKFEDSGDNFSLPKLSGEYDRDLDDD